MTPADHALSCCFSGENQWLHPDVRVLEHDLPRSAGPLVLHFLVRYYPESFTLLRDPAAVELFYQQAKSGVFKVSSFAHGWSFGVLPWLDVVI